MERNQSFVQVENMLQSVEDEMQIISGAFRVPVGRWDDPHPWTHGDVGSYTRLMRGEEELPHIPDGSCVECRIMFEEQFKLVKSKLSERSVLTALRKAHHVSALDFVRNGLAEIREHGGV